MALNGILFLCYKRYLIDMANIRYRFTVLKSKVLIFKIFFEKY